MRSTRARSPPPASHQCVQSRTSRYRDCGDHHISRDRPPSLVPHGRSWRQRGRSRTVRSADVQRVRSPTTLKDGTKNGTGGVGVRGEAGAAHDPFGSSDSAATERIADRRRVPARSRPASSGRFGRRRPRRASLYWMSTASGRAPDGVNMADFVIPIVPADSSHRLLRAACPGNGRRHHRKISRRRRRDSVGHAPEKLVSQQFFDWFQAFASTVVQLSEFGASTSAR